jgi:hypothetical protein
MIAQTKCWKINFDEVGRFIKFLMYEIQKKIVLLFYSH